MARIYNGETRYESLLRLSKLDTDECVIWPYFREMLCDSVDRKLIMKAFNISPMTVSRIARNQAWRNA